MQWPINGHYTITSNYGMRVHPITGVYKLHTGVDISATTGDDFTAMAAVILEGLGGSANVKSIDNCITRLRLEINDDNKIDEAKIKSSGAAGIIRPGKGNIQVIIGPKVQFVADEMEKLCK